MLRSRPSPMRRVASSSPRTLTFTKATCSGERQGNCSGQVDCLSERVEGPRLGEPGTQHAKCPTDVTAHDSKHRVSLLRQVEWPGRRGLARRVWRLPVSRRVIRRLDSPGLVRWAQSSGASGWWLSAHAAQSPRAWWSRTPASAAIRMDLVCGLSPYSPRSLAAASSRYFSASWW